MSDEPKWDDLQLVLLIEKHGTLRAVARATGVSHPTLSRHLARLSKTTGGPVFDRDGARLVPTETGEILLRAARDMRRLFDDAVRCSIGRHAALDGLVRVSMAPIMLRMIAPTIGALCERHPKLGVDVDTSVHLSDLRRRQADVVLRASPAPGADLVGRKIGPFAAALFGNVQLARRARSGAPLETLPWVDWRSELNYPSSRWVQEQAPGARICARVSTTQDMLELIAAGVGVGYLWTPAAGEHRGLRRIASAPPLDWNIWALTRPELRRTPRIRVVLRALAEGLGEVIESKTPVA